MFIITLNKSNCFSAFNLMTTVNAAFIIMGDFNDFNTDIFEQHTLLTQVVEHATIRGNSVLDKILTDLVDRYQEPVVSAPISSSDHFVK